MSLKIKLNDTAFKNSVKVYAKELNPVLKDALELTGMRVVKDIITLPPKAPILDGFLTGAFTVQVTDRDTVYPEVGGSTPPKGGETGKNSKRTLDPDQVAEVDKSGMEKYELRIGNYMKYAARLHENPFTAGEWSERRGNVGYKFITVKLYGYGEKYLQLFAEFVKQRLRGRMFK
ncbi:hypothetical protein [Leptospira levettii]|uniref:hypothetical protein n=1 Tax=Leptospira levettii TaxID=2023178 RepID=UPI000C2A04C5|nr:hypothetical protein [Leptospira levettii]PJZ87931.1 hypothetical protein CH368_14310 [Leptospira levettii]